MSPPLYLLRLLINELESALKSVFPILVMAAEIELTVMLHPAEAQEINSSDAEIVSRVSGIVDRALERPGAVGLSVAVVRDESVVFEAGAGIADLEWNIGANSNTVFRIGSVPK